MFNSIKAVLNHSGDSYLFSNRNESDTYNRLITEASRYLDALKSYNTSLELSDHLKKTSLGLALLEHKVFLQDLAKNEENRNWITSGIKQFLETILRNDSDINLDTLSESFFKFIIKYVGVNQGALYLVNDRDESAECLEIAASYAVDKKNVVSKSIKFGVGLIGQCAVEKKEIHLTNLPDGFFSIKSGLGNASPSSVLIVPLVSNNKTLGVLEMASLSAIPQYKIDFIKNVSVTIASHFDSIKNNQNVKKMLAISQNQTKMLTLQEEQMKHTFEEMRATQDDLSLKNIEIAKTTKALESILAGINLSMAMVECTPYGTVVNANQKFLEVTGYGQHHLKDKHFNKLWLLDVPTVDFWESLSKKELKSGIFQLKNYNDEVVWLNATFNPILDADDNVSKVVMLGIDITSEKEHENRIQHMLKKTRLQEESLKQNEGELQDVKDGIAKVLSTKMFDMEAREEAFGINTVFSESDLNGNITYCNKKLIEISKYSRRELMGKPHNILRHPDMPKELFKRIWLHIQRGERFRAILKNRAKDGSHYWVDASFVPVKDSMGNITKYLGARYVIGNEQMAIMMYNDQMAEMNLLHVVNTLKLNE